MEFERYVEEMIESSVKGLAIYHEMKQMDRATFSATICALNDMYCKDHGIDASQNMLIMAASTMRVHEEL